MKKRYEIGKTTEEIPGFKPFEREYILDIKTGKIYFDEIETEDLMPMGYCPKIKNKNQRLKHDILHGLIMNYSLLDVIIFSIKNYFDLWDYKKATEDMIIFASKNNLKLISSENGEYIFEEI